MHNFIDDRRPMDELFRIESNIGEIAAILSVNSNEIKQEFEPIDWI